MAQLSAFVLRYEPGVTAGFALTKMAGFTGLTGTVALAVVGQFRRWLLRGGRLVNRFRYVEAGGGSRW